MNLKKIMQKTYSVIIALLVMLVCGRQGVLGVTAADVTFINEDTVKIKDAEDLLELAELCTLDSWSRGKTVVLQADIYLGDVDFEPISSFGGTFDGKGHMISGLEIVESISPAGLFGVVQEGAVIKNVNVSGKVEPAGEADAVGGIAGENYGQILNCTFTGTVSGQQNTGGIVGMNGPGGEISNCRTNGTVFGQNMTGGIVGYNQGYISKCKNDMSVNDESVNPTLSLEDINVEISLDVTKLNTMNMLNVASDSGGIAGYSTGVIESCSNTVVVGYPHIGYNLGGIAGRSCGYILDCMNEGEIYGRKDVGGIVGQVEPYILVRLSESGIAEIKQEIEALSNMLDTAEAHMDSGTADLKRNVAQIQKYTQKMQELLTDDSMEDAKLGTRLSDLMVQTYMLSKQMEALGQDVKEGAGTLSQDLNSITRQSGRLSDTFERVMQEAEDAALSDFVKDASEADVEAVTYGKVAACVNSGAVYADTNVGGIAGIISLEQDLDPEDDLTGDFSIKERRQYELTAILSECVNQATVAAKKDYAGGICGRMDLGLITGCEGYGYIYSESGDYVGGIAGMTGSTVRNSFAKCSLAGADYIGGIVGTGITEDATGESSLVSQCYSLVDIKGYQQFAGAVAGVKAGAYRQCYFVSEELAGINRTSYEGQAEPVSYEELLAVKGLPEAFEQFTLSFVMDGEVVYGTTFEYGASFDAEIFPVLPRVEGYHLTWDTTELRELKKDTVVTAVYHYYSSALASKEERGKNKPVFLAEGQFTQGDEMVVREKETDFTPEEQSLLDKVNPGKVVEQWSIKVPDDGLLIHTLRYLPPEEVIDEPDIYVKQDGKWKKADAEVVGSYLMFHIAGTEAEIAVVKEAGVKWTWLIGIGLAVIVIGGGVWLLSKKKNITACLIWLLGAVLFIVAVLLGLTLYKGNLKNGINAYHLLQEYLEQPAQAMDFKLEGKLGEEAFDLEARIFVTELDGRQVTCVEQSGVVLYYADGILYLENGKAYRASEVSSDYAGILNQLVLLYQELEFESEKDGARVAYHIRVKEENTGEFLGYLLPEASEGVLETDTLEGKIISESEQLWAVSVSSGGKLNGEAYDIQATFEVADVEDGAIEIPTEVQENIQAENPQVEDLVSEDVFRMYGAWKRLFDSDPLGTKIILNVDCGPLNLQEDVTLITTLQEDTRINCIQEGDFAVYFTEDTICSEQGYAVTAKRAETIGVAELLGIAYGLCLNGTFSSTEVDGSYIYSLALDEEAMQEIAAAIAKESTDMAIRFENGSIQVMIKEDRVESIRFACDGNMDVLITKVAVAFSAELDMTDAKKYQSFNVPQKVLDALKK